MCPQLLPKMSVFVHEIMANPLSYLYDVHFSSAGTNVHLFLGFLARLRTSLDFFSSLESPV